MKPRKVLERIIAGSRNVRFADFCGLVNAFGFRLDRISGSHHIFVHPNVPILVNVQNVGGKAKLYQMVQFLKLVEEYNLQLEDDPS